MRRLALILAGGVLAVSGCGGTASQTGTKANDKLLVSSVGWRTDFSKHVVPLGEFASGGPGKDGIPALDHPQFQRASDIDYIAFPEPVIESTVGGETRGYPIQILIWHEIVNDEVGGVPVTVTFCPLCNTAIVFDRRVDGKTLDFGTTGNLRNSDLVMYDRQTESWWQQFGGAALVGRYAGTRLKQIPARIVSWHQFSNQHPRSLVLDRPVGPLGRPYGQNPYAGYDNVSTPPFFGAAHGDDRRLLPKERVVFIERGDKSVAVPFSVLAKKRKIEVEVGGHDLTITWKPGVTSALDNGYIARGRDVGAADVRENGKTVSFDQPFWFSVASFRPHVKIVR